jgi:hypothetical protein
LKKLDVFKDCLQGELEILYSEAYIPFCKALIAETIFIVNE